MRKKARNEDILSSPIVLSAIVGRIRETIFSSEGINKI